MDKRMAVVLAGALIFAIAAQISLNQVAKADQVSQNVNGHDHMRCMSMSQEEMDGDNDGICDNCGMQVSECGNMMGKGDMGAMMGDHHGMMGSSDGASCHMKKGGK